MLNRDGQYLVHKYGPGSGNIWVDNLQCSGTENDILDCNGAIFTTHNCGHNEDVSISCQGCGNRNLSTPVQRLYVFL